MTVSAADLATLAHSHDIITLGMHADEARRARHGRQTTFVRVADIPADPAAPIEVPPDAGELRIVGVPGSLALAAERVRAVVAVAGQATVTAFSLADLERLAASEQVALTDALVGLREAGLVAVAEAPFDRLAHAEGALASVRQAGLALARLTIDKLPAVDPLSLLSEVRALQASVGCVRAFAPLPRRVNPAAPTTGFDDVRRVALARLVVDNVESIQVDWTLYGPKLAQVALTVGADDVDGVSALGDGGLGRRRAPLEEVRRNIEAAGFEPAERDGRFAVAAR